MIGRPGVGEHPQPPLRGELDDVAAERAGGPGDRDGRPGMQLEQVERLHRGEPVHRQRGRLDEAGPGRHPGDGVGVGDEELDVGAAVSHQRDRHGHDLVADPPGGGVAIGRRRPHLVDHAGGVHAGDVRRRELARAPTTLAQRHVGGVHRGGTHGDPHLARAGMGLGHVVDREHLGPTGGEESDDPHALSAHGQRPSRRRRAANST